MRLFKKKRGDTSDYMVLIIVIALITAAVIIVGIGILKGKFEFLSGLFFN